jgi:hypothetical protein
MSNNLDNLTKEFNLMNSEIHPVDTHANVLNEISVEKSFVQRFLKIENLILLSIPIVILIILIFLKPKFVLDISEDKEVPPRINFKKLLLTTSIVSVILGGLCYFYIFKKFFNSNAIKSD